MIARAIAACGARVARGFTVIELLVAMSIVLVISAALAAAAAPAREAFERVPMELDLQQRGRTAIDAIASQVRSAVLMFGDDQTLTVAVPILQGGRGMVDVDQATPSAPMVLSTAACPPTQDLCGFVSGAIAVVRDPSATADVFEVIAVSAPARSLTPDGALSQSYHAGDLVAAVDEYTFSLAGQSDGSYTLIRETAAGAIQPIVDFVSDLSFAVDDRRVDMAIRVQPTGASRLAPRDFRATVSLRNAP
jgi:prepilin-type N-terminal cleavage/methylation domain-containing protein